MQIINATVFIQAINFFITYLFLKKVFFAPIVRRIMQKEDAKTKMLRVLKEKEALLLTLQNEKTENLEQFRQETRKYYAIDVTAHQDASLEQRLGTITYKKDVDQQDKMVEQTKKLLIKKVPYAY